MYTMMKTSGEDGPDAAAQAVQYAHVVRERRGETRPRRDAIRPPRGHAQNFRRADGGVRKNARHLRRRRRCY